MRIYTCDFATGIIHFCIAVDDDLEGTTACVVCFIGYAAPIICEPGREAITITNLNTFVEHTNAQGIGVIGTGGTVHPVSFHRNIAENDTAKGVLSRRLQWRG
jgi:hypothetical protein